MEINGVQRVILRSAPTMMLVCQRLKRISWDKFQPLSENRIMMGHGLNLPVVTVFCRKFIVTACWDLSLFYRQFMGQQ